MNVLRYCNLDESLQGEDSLVCHSALERLYKTKELDYMSNIVLRMFENTEVVTLTIFRMFFLLDYLNYLCFFFAYLTVISIKLFQSKLEPVYSSSCPDWLSNPETGFYGLELVQFRNLAGSQCLTGSRHDFESLWLSYRERGVSKSFSNLKLHIFHVVLTLRKLISWPLNQIQLYANSLKLDLLPSPLMHSLKFWCGSRCSAIP